MKYVSYREIGIKACGLVAIIAMFLPFIHVEDYYQLSVFDMFFGLEEVSVNSPEVMTYVILLLFALIMAIAVIVLNEDYIIVFALSGIDSNGSCSIFTGHGNKTLFKWNDWKFF